MVSYPNQERVAGEGLKGRGLGNGTGIYLGAEAGCASANRRTKARTRGLPAPLAQVGPQQGFW